MNNYQASNIFFDRYNRKNYEFVLSLVDIAYILLQDFTQFMPLAFR